MPTLTDIRSAGEADLQDILKGLDERHKRQVRQAVKRYGRVQDVPQAFWDELREETETETVTALYLLMIAADDWTADAIKGQKQGLRANQADAAGYGVKAGRRAMILADRTTDTLRNRLATRIEDAKLSRGAGSELGEMTPQELDAAIDDVFTQARRDAIAANETTGSMSAGQLGGRDRFAPGSLRDTQIDLVWVTERDDRVCFPAGTLVETEAGPRPIQTLHIGDMVATRRGLRPVIATMRRRYAGDLTTVVAGGHAVTSTADHPFWTLEQEWVAASQLNANLSLYGLDHKPRKIDRVFNFSLADSHHSPASVLKILGFSGISGGIAMPVGSVNLDGDSLLKNGEVDGISPDTMLGRCCDPNRRKGRADSRLGLCFRSRAAIARYGAKLLDLVVRAVPDFFAACFAVNNVRWSSALFGAEVPIQSRARVIPESLSATLADNVLGFRFPAGETANIEAAGNRGVDGKRLAAYPARLFNLLCVQKSAGARTALVPANRGTSCRKIERNLADLAGAIHAIPLTLGRRMLHFLKGFGHAELYQKWTHVYDIQVAEYPEFFANGVLVHNCPRCSPLDGTTEDVWGLVFPDGPGESAHVSCRCELKPVVRALSDAERVT